MKLFAFAAAAAAAALVPAAASADVGNGFYVGLQGGYHDFEAGVDGGVFGGFAGYNREVGNGIVLGVEGNYNIGTNDVDSEYGASVHIGTKIGGDNLLFVRGGYQEVNFDLSSIAGGPVTGVDDTDGDYLVGVGADIGVTPKSALRIAVDTIAFDSVRATAGVSYRF